MSIDIGIYGMVYSELEDGLNVTTNLQPMFVMALNLPGGLKDLNDLTGAEALTRVKRAVSAMLRRPDEYAALNPPNGWGNSDIALKTLRKLEDWCERHPKGELQVRW